MKIAMWSGPRNLSTAMMYSFGNRAEMTVIDEPFYAAYLAKTGIDHPMRDVIISSGSTDPQAVSERIMSAGDNLFLKLISMHMQPGFPWEWADACRHIYLIRHPARVVASYTAKREAPTLRDIGFEEQYRLYQRYPGPVVSSFDIRADPEGMLRKLCEALGLAFDPAMLRWPTGSKPFDGVWAPHWYDAVHRSNGFSGAEGPLPVVTGDAEKLVSQAMPFYQEMEKAKL